MARTFQRQNASPGSCHSLAVIQQKENTGVKGFFSVILAGVSAFPVSLSLSFS